MFEKAAISSVVVATALPLCTLSFTRVSRAEKSSSQMGGLNNHNAVYIVGESGNKVAELFSIGDEPTLVMRDAKGHNRLWLQVSNGEPSITMWRGKEKRVLTFEDLPVKKGKRK